MSCASLALVHRTRGFVHLVGRSYVAVFLVASRQWIGYTRDNLAHTARLAPREVLQAFGFRPRSTVRGLSSVGELSPGVDRGPIRPGVRGATPPRAP